MKRNDVIYKNGVRELADIDQLPYEDFDVFEEKRFFRPMQGKIFRMIPVTIDRGCPYNCSFCAAPLQRKFYSDAGQSGYFRIKTTSRVVEELQYHVGRYKADYIYFNSETFLPGKKRILRSSRGYASKIGLPLLVPDENRDYNRKENKTP